MSAKVYLRELPRKIELAQRIAETTCGVIRAYLEMRCILLREFLKPAMPFSDKENSTDAIVTARPTETIAGLETNAIAGIAVQADLKRPPILPRILVFVVLLIGAIAGFAYFIVHRRAPEVAISSIAVLPLNNLSDDPSQAYFADGMTDALIGDLAKITDLRVISRTSSMHYKGSKKPLPEIARELRVDAVVEGTIQRVGEQILVRAQLIQAATDEHLWVKEYRRDVKNVLDLQSEIARDIANEVRLHQTR